MVLRKMVSIDEEKCTGCGLCIPSCAEGALRIVDGKAELISDKYCDGLGACIGECPQGALVIQFREADEFDESAVKRHLKEEQSDSSRTNQPCPSAALTDFGRNLATHETDNASQLKQSRLSQWPVQLALLPPDAQLFENADLLIAADCVPFAYANFHDDFLSGKVVVVGCPKLDDAEGYKRRLADTFKRSHVKSLTVVNMEVPCCFGLYRLVKDALDLSGKTIPLKQQIISVRGEKIPNQILQQASR